MGCASRSDCCIVLPLPVSLSLSAGHERAPRKGAVPLRRTSQLVRRSISRGSYTFSLFFPFLFWFSFPFDLHWVYRAISNFLRMHIFRRRRIIGGHFQTRLPDFFECVFQPKATSR